MTARRSAVVTALALAVASCGSDGSTGGELTVSAAASLTEPFTELAERFEADHPDVEVRLNFGGSAQLAQQVVAGAPVDVFASANRATMEQVEEVTDGEPAVFTHNTLVIAVPEGNPADVTGIADFARPELTLAVCLEQVPCGAAAREVFDLAGINAQPDTYEPDVRAVLSKVELGEVDAGLVYRTDVATAEDRVDAVEFAEADQVVNDYLVVAVSDADLAGEFVDLVRSRDGQAVLADAGFAGGGER